MGDYEAQRAGGGADLHVLLDSVSDGFYALDADWRFTVFNASAERFFGRRREDVIGQRLLDAFPEARGSMFECAYRRVLRDRVPISFETRSMARPERFVEMRAAPLPDGGIAVAFSDITERRSAAERLRASEEQLRLMADNTLALMWISDAEGRVEFANWHYQRLFGGVGTLFEARWREVGRPEDLQCLTQCSERARRDRQPLRIEFRVRTDGGERWLRCEALPRHDAQGMFAGFVGIGLDLTESKRHEQALADATRRLDAILNNTTMAIFQMDERQQCVYMNQAAEALTGYSLEETRGRPLHDVVHHTRPDGRPYPLAECPIDRAFPERAQMQGEEVFVHRDGSFYPVAFTASPILVDGQPQGTIIEVRNIAEEKARERQLHETLERLSLVLRATQDTVWDWDLVHDHILWNESLLTAFGHDPAHVPPSLEWWSEQLHPEDRDAVNQSLLAVIEGGGSHWSAEYRFRRGDGTWADVLDRGYVLCDESGRGVRMIGAMLDLSQRKAAEQALAESRAWLRKLIDAADEGFYAIDEDGRTTLCNAAFLRMLGFESEQEVIGRQLHYLIHHTHADGTPYDHRHCPISRCAVEGTPAHVVGEFFYTRDGRAFPVEYRASPIVIDGRVRGTICTFVDITERLRAESALRESEARFRNMADHAPVMMWLTDADGRCTYLNRQWYRFTGQSGGEGHGLGWLDAVHPDDRGEAERHFLDANRQQRGFRVEYRLRRADGRYRWVIDSAAPRFGDDGRFLGFIGSVIDIDERREIETRLRDSEARLRLATEAAAIGTWDYNPLTGELVWDARAKTLYGLPPEAAVDYDLFLRSLHPDDRERVDALVKRTLGAGDDEGFDVEYRVVGLQDGRQRWVAAKGRAIAEGDGERRRAVRFVGVVADITERKRYEQELRELNETLEQRVQQEVAVRARTEEALRQSQKLEAIGQLTGGVAHDFNNLLTVIRSSLYLLRQHDLAPERRARYLDAIRETVDRAAKLTSQLLAFARRQPLQPEVFDAGERVRSSLDLLQATVGSRVVLDVQVAEDTCYVEADPNQFDTALLNLAINARDAMDGKGTLRIQVEPVDLLPGADGPRRGPFVAVRVADTGCGIPEAVLPRIFEPFYTTKEVGRGTGLGLSQVYGFVKQSGGEVVVESRPGDGSAFTLYLPKSERDAREPTPEAGTARIAGSAQPGRILLVEDNRQVGESISHVLEDLGCEVEWLGCPLAALERLAADAAFDVVLSDIVMPGRMDGLEFAREVERRHPELAVVLATGYSHTLAAGGELRWPLLRKPFTVEELSQVLGRVMRQRRAGHAP
ncbi:MAG: PAS domain S-box protein [Pseudomonadota bacterium]